MQVIIRQKINIVTFIGFMAGGKTVTGNFLAKKLGFNFIDVDFVVEKLNRNTIKQIVENQGLFFFRQQEKSIISFYLLKGKYIVLPIGGGSILSFTSKYLLNQNTFLICLKTNFYFIKQRYFNYSETEKRMFNSFRLLHLIYIIRIKILIKHVNQVETSFNFLEKTVRKCYYNFKYLI